jgi:hypothetical protein
MRISQFTVATSRTINLGNFESLRLEASVVVDLLEGDNMEFSRVEAQKQLRQLLEDTYRHQFEERLEKRKMANK